VIISAMDTVAITRFVTVVVFVHCGEMAGLTALEAGDQLESRIEGGSDEVSVVWIELRVEVNGAVVSNGLA
jgi:hypothetical protein